MGMTKLLFISKADFLFNMVVYRSDEDALVSFLNCFNQVFLIYVIFTITFTMCTEDRSKDVLPTEEDYNFNLDTALTRSADSLAVPFLVCILLIIVLLYLGRKLGFGARGGDMEFVQKFVFDLQYCIGSDFGLFRILIVNKFWIIKK